MEAPIADYIQGIPDISPKEMFLRLSQNGYKGQEAARKSLCLAAYRHVKRLKSIHCNEVARTELPPKQNTLLMGPTGCGKTFLVQQLFMNILRLPTVLIDITGFSETGYVGRDPITILTSLLHAAGDDAGKAQIGIVCIDEFDKLASTQNTARFEGQGTTKDVGGYGVQKELLKLLSSTVLDVPLEYANTYYSTHVKMNTADIMFVACGAFSGFKDSVLPEQEIPKIGYFHPVDPKPCARGISYDLTESEVSDTVAFQNYGIMPELMGRFTRIIGVQPLDKETLRSILVDNVLKRYTAEFDREGHKFSVHEEVLQYIVEKTMRRETGARGLEAELTGIIEDAAFNCFGGDRTNVSIIVENGRPKVISKPRKSVA